MDTEKIINEWFYRLPNGYANYPYSDKELAVLHEVLDANGLSLDSPQEIRQTKVQRLIEQDVKADVNDVASLLFSADLDQESLLEIQELIIQVGFKKTILPYLASKGITGNEIAKQANRLNRRLGTYGNGDNLDASHYAGSKTKGRLQKPSENRRSRLKIRG